VLFRSGMGRVYKVRNVISDRVEAMKILLPDLAGRQELAERFLREIKLLATLDHPNIAALRTALTLNNQLVMIMEYVEGTTLAQRLERTPIAPAEAVNYIDQVLSALSYAHGRKVIHRDIKPSNMMLTPQGAVKLMDFGIARSGNDRGLTMTGTTLGSLYYMSPEQVKGATTDARSDLYSVGVSLYEMVTGQRPFQADSDYSILAAHLEQAPKPPISIRGDLAPGLNDIILMAMEKDPSRRFQSADSFRTALKSIGISAVAREVRAPASTPPVASEAAPIAAPGPAAVGGSATALFNNQPPMIIQPGNIPGAQNTPLPPVGQYVGDATPVPATGNRGLYMALGALVVLAVLVAAGLYVPHYMKAKAGEQASSNSQQSSQQSTSQQPTDTPQTPPPTTPDNSNPPSADGNVANTPITPNPIPTTGGGDDKTVIPAPPAASPESGNGKTGKGERKERAKPRAPGINQHPPETVPQVGGGGNGIEKNPPPDTTPSATQFEQLEQQFDQLSSRANAVSSSLDTLQREQASQGLNLRGDIAGSQERLRNYTAKAQAALQAHDLKSAQKYMDLAEPELEKIEKFLGH